MFYLTKIFPWRNLYKYIPRLWRQSCFRPYGHPVIVKAKQGERWMWKSLSNSVIGKFLVKPVRLLWIDLLCLKTISFLCSSHKSRSSLYNQLTNRDKFMMFDLMFTIDPLFATREESFSPVHHNLNDANVSVFFTFGMSTFVRRRLTLIARDDVCWCPQTIECC